MKTTTQIHPRLLAALSGRTFANTRPPTQAPASARPPPVSAPDAQSAIEELRARMVEAHGQSEAIRATADQEHRNLTEDEQKKLDDLSALFDSLDQEVQRRERLEAQRSRLGEPRPRVTQPSPAPGDDAPAPALRATPGYSVGEQVGVTKGSYGFRSIGEFARAVIASSRGQVDQRIIAAASTYGNEGTPADGGYAVPPDFRETIYKTMQGEESLLALTDQQFTSSNKITVPRDATTPWQTSGGILATWEAEANATTPTKPSLGTVEVPAHKLKALVPMTDELMEDAPSLSRYLPGKVAEKFTSKINDAIINGDGSGKPTGILAAGGSLITVDDEESQEDPVVFQNISKMWARLYARLRSTAVWLINQDLEPYLMGMTVPGSTPAFPAYLPPGGLSERPFATLLGRPVIPMEACAAAGAKGSIILFDPKSYLTVQKVGGIRQAVSMHLYFDQDIAAFRFVMRLGGKSWWGAAASRPNSADSVSNIVTLDAVGT